MSLAKDQLKKALTDFEGDLNEPKSTLGKRIQLKEKLKNLGKCQGNVNEVIMDITSFLKTGIFKDLSVGMSYSNFQKLK